MHVVKVIFLTINCSLLLQVYIYVLQCRLLLNVEVSFCRQCQWPRGIRRVFAGVGFLGFWFESRREHVSLSLECVVFCELELFTTSWSLVEGSSTDVGVSWVWSWSPNNEEDLAHKGMLWFVGGRNTVCNQWTAWNTLH